MPADGSIALSTLAGWLLLAATAISAGYELWRALARTGVGPGDSLRDLTILLPVYTGAVVVGILLLVGWELAPILGFAYAVLATIASTFWYGPNQLLQRRPQLIDWVEDRAFTILVGAVAVLLAFDLLGISLVA